MPIIHQDRENFTGILEKFEAIVNDSDPIEVQIAENAAQVLGRTGEFDISKSGEFTFHIIHQGVSFAITILKADRETKTVRLKVNGKWMTVSLSSELDRVLKKMGLEGNLGKDVLELKAPMPGKIHKVLVKEGSEVKKGEALLVLEAMKMENVIRCPSDVRISEIPIRPGDSVEKGALLMRFESSATQ